MFWTIVALVMTVLMGGIIAYNGDLIGRKFGKRRLSLFKLRPKHTAILITSFTGALISGGTTLVIFLLVPPVRNVILRGEQALRQNRILLVQNRVADSKIATSTAKLAQNDIKIAEQQELIQSGQLRITSLRKDLRVTQVELTTETAKTLALAKDVSSKVALLASLAKDVRRQKDQQEILRQQNTFLASSNKRLEAANVDLAAERTKLQADNVIAAMKNSELALQNNELSQDNENLVRERGKLNADRARLAVEVDERTSFNDNLIQQKIKLIAESDGLEKRIAQLEGDNRNLERATQAAFGQYRTLSEMFEAMRTRRVAVHGGDDLARRVVPADAPPSAVRQVVAELMHDASMAAIARGAAPGDRARAVHVVDKQFFTRVQGSDVAVTVTEQQRIDALVGRLAWSAQPVCLVALAVANSVEQEPAAIDFQPFGNSLVYQKGEAVAVVRIAGGKSVNEIAGEVVRFLKTTGQAAIQKGMIPRIDPGTGEPQIGSLDIPEILRLVETIRDKGRPVRLVARAVAPTNSGDALLIDFRVEPSL